MEILILLIYLMILIGVGWFWGWVVSSIIENKGYDENWFWWGFFFGVFAMAVALTKPDCYTYDSSYNNYMQAERDEERLSHGGWKCSCGRVNASYTGTCACGLKKN